MHPQELQVIRDAQARRMAIAKAAALQYSDGVQCMIDCNDLLAEVDRLTAAIAAQQDAREARIENLETALGQIAGKNNLEGVPNDEVLSAMAAALHECELIARNALEQAGERGDGD